MNNFLQYLIGLVENAWAKHPLPRQPESEMVVETPEELTDYNQAMQNSSWIYVVFSAELISHVIKNCTRVLDIGCGSGDLLITVAKANPHITFVGADQSDIALAVGERNVKEQGITNVTFIKSDLQTLTSIADHSFDGIMTRFTLHHLPDEAALTTAFTSIRRVAKEGSALWISDFQRLKSERLIKTICYRREAEAGKIVSDLFYESLHAAFDFETLDRAATRVFSHGKSILTKIVPVYFAYRTPLYDLSPETLVYFRTLKKTFTFAERMTLASLWLILSLGGYYRKP